MDLTPPVLVAELLEPRSPLSVAALAPPAHIATIPVGPRPRPGLPGDEVDMSAVADSVGRVLVPEGWGSAVLLDERGTLATARHVLGPVRVGARFSVEIGGRLRDAAFIGAPPDMDVAFLRLGDAAGTIPVRWSARVELGERFTAIGFPGPGHGSGRMRVDGVVTGFGRTQSYELSWAQWRSDQLATGSVALLPGQSGGAVVNRRGELIGISQATLMDVASGRPLPPSYFLPADLLKRAYRSVAGPDRQATARPTPMVAAAPVAKPTPRAAVPPQSARRPVDGPPRAAAPPQPAISAAAASPTAATPPEPPPVTTPPVTAPPVTAESRADQPTASPPQEQPAAAPSPPIAAPTPAVAAQKVDAAAFAALNDRWRPLDRPQTVPLDPSIPPSLFGRK